MDLSDFCGYGGRLDRGFLGVAGIAEVTWNAWFGLVLLLA
jgi:hypothetical protein